MSLPALNRVRHGVGPWCLALLLACGGGSTKAPEVTTPPPSLTISGSITGEAPASIGLALSGPATASTTSDAKGQYHFANLQPGSYTVTPSLMGHSFTPASRTTTLTTGDQAGQDFVAAKNPVPPPAALTGRYRYQQSALFLDAPAGVLAKGSGNFYESPARGSVAPAKVGYSWGTVGPTPGYVDLYSGWRWAHAGGDWVDSKGVAQGPAATWSITANAETADAAQHTYTADLTQALQTVQTSSRWNAYIVRVTGGNRTFATRHHPSAAAPSLTVTYQDSTTATLACLAAVPLITGTSYSQVGAPEATLAGSQTSVLEFERPAKAVKIATLSLVVTRHTATAAVISGDLANPPVNANPTLAGLASAHPLDQGITSEAGLLFSHRYEDGTKASDVFATVPGYWNPSNWSQHLFNPALAPQADRLPYIHQGKWILKQDAGVALVDSAFKGHGFAPLAPGLGALKVVLPGRGLPDGSSVGYSGSLGSDLMLLLPEPEIGLLDEVYLRYYVRLGNEAMDPLSTMPMYRNEAAATATFATYTGKFGMGPAHHTYYGGNNNIGGGNIGWSNRGAWREMPGEVPIGGIVPGAHVWDMLGDLANERENFGAQGGLGAALYPGHWYCIETRLKLNSIRPSNAQNGEMDVWIDGRLTYSLRDFSYRKLPLNYTDPTQVYSNATRMGYTPMTSLPPFRELGVASIWLNDFQGGTIAAEHDRVRFYTGLVVAKRYIGPMTLPGGPLP